MKRLWILSCVLSAACSKPPEPDATTSSPPKSTTEAAAPAPGRSAAPSAPAGPTDLAWDAPAAWQKSDNPSSMRKATYKIPKAPGDPEDAELSVSQAGGTVEMNVKRWEAQFDEKRGETQRDPRTIGDLKVTVIEVHGKFTGSGMPGAPPGPAKPGYALLGAIVETRPPHFFKLTGPEKTVLAAKPDFDKMVQSFRAK